VAATGTLGEIWVWDLATGKLIDVLEFPEGTIWVAYTHDGSVLLGGARDGSVRGFATSDHSPLLATTWSVDGSPASIGAMALSPDGRLLATAGSGRIDLWRVEE
jgi:WD40 repeat protein